MPKKVIKTNRGIQVGREVRTLLNLLIGANTISDFNGEIEKIDYLKSHAEKIDIITDLSLQRFDNPLWEYVLNNTNYMAGTVPVYLSLDSKGNVDENLLFDSICEQCEKGVSIITIHPTVSRRMLEMSKKRIIPCTSRGGGIVARDLIKNNRDENVYLQLLDKIAQKCKACGTVISVGSTFRSGTIIDALDQLYLLELEEQIRIADHLDSLGVDAIVETPGHIDAEKLLILCEKLENNQHPIMPLGPMLTDIGFEEDDTVAVIGASLMGVHDCADVLTIVTSREHLSGIPTIDDLKKAIAKYQVAKHIIDLHKVHDYKEDLLVSEERARKKTCDVSTGEFCDRCKEVCPLRIL